MDPVRVLVLNAGSSSLKASLIEAPDRTLSRTEVRWGSDASRKADRSVGLRQALKELGRAAVAAGPATGRRRQTLDVDVVGHRVVHGGARFTASTLIGEDVLAEIRAVRDLAPLHNDVAVETIEAARDLLPGVTQVAAFDTAFHASLLPETYRYAVPERWYDEWGVRRFGFHGLSVAWSVRQAGVLLERRVGDLAIVVAHLGSGCSVTAVRGGRSVDTSMGLTPLEGLMMGTRSGSIDPGVPLRLIESGRLSAAQVADDLDHHSGLLGVSGISADMRAISVAADAGHERARLALAMFARRAAAGIAAAATSLPKLDALVFTGGIGENAGGIRRDIVARLGVLGIAPLAEAQPHARDRDGCLSSRDDRVAILRVEAREDLVIAAETLALLA